MGFGVRAAAPHSAPFWGERGFRQGCRNKDTPSFKHGCLQVVEQSRCRTHRQQTTTVAQMQRQQSVLKRIWIEDKHFFEKTYFFYKLEFVIIFYKKDDGTEPAKEFLDGLDNKMRAKMIRTVELLRDYGYELREPYSKHLNDGIFELRAKVSTDITRVLYFFVSGRKAILTHGFVKKTQKTPQSEIEKAENYRKDYLSKNKS